jgi:hypothetical protein
MTYQHKLDPSPSSPNFPGYCHAHLLPGKNDHSWALYKYGDHWAFNHWQTQKYDEGLLNGSEKCLDQHYFNLTKQHPNWDSTLLVTLSTDPHHFGDYKPTAKLTYLKEWEMNPKASWYTDDALGDGFLWWLCPFWGQLFPNGEPPQECYMLLTTND